MKIFNLLLVALFTCTIGLSGLSGNSDAASNKKEATSSTGTAEAGKIATETKAAKAKKEIPHNVNINTADKALLIQLPGIGPVTADSIIQYRKDNGQFKSIGELTKVKGIGSKTLVKMEPYLQKI